MTKSDTIRMMGELKKVFSIVRLVDANMHMQYSINDKGEVERLSGQCYEIWDKNKECENCTSFQAMIKKTQMAKFEFIGEEVYYVISKYIEIEGTPFVLELVNVVDNDTLFGAQGHDQLVMKIVSYSKKIYLDPLTGARNRRYLEEQYQALNLNVAVAMLDVDNFKEINDYYGHHAGDLALKEIGKTILSKIRAKDILVRYGGDEFLLAFAELSQEVFFRRLETIREAVSQIMIEEYPELRLTISVGGVYRNSGEVLDMIKEADKILYQSKEEKNKVTIVTK